MTFQTTYNTYAIYGQSCQGDLAFTSVISGVYKLDGPSDVIAVQSRTHIFQPNIFPLIRSFLSFHHFSRLCAQNLLLGSGKDSNVHFKRSDDSVYAVLCFSSYGNVRLTPKNAFHVFINYFHTFFPLINSQKHTNTPTHKHTKTQNTQTHTQTHTNTTDLLSLR